MALILIVAGLGFFLGQSEGVAVGNCIHLNSYTQDDRACDLYYICTRTGWLAASCPPTQLFNPNIMACVTASNYNCPYTPIGGGVSGSGPGCSPGTCLNGGMCMPSSDGLGRCRCRSGFTGDRCETATGGVSTPTTGQTCTDLKCVNGGRCFKETTGTSRCYCPSPFGGALCDTKQDSDGVCPVPKESTCDPACENGGKCFEADGEPKCFCPEGFNGDRCELTLGKCEMLECQNRGECVLDSDGEASCSCPEPYAGKSCELEVSDACYALQCENNAPCVKIGSNTLCDCPDGYIGDRCQYEDPCPKIQCLHGGKCEAGGRGQALCKCEVGYTGSFCEIALDCEGFTCYNGGECKIVDSERVCECPDRTSGDKCENRLQCAGDSLAPCQNGGQCVNSEDGFRCICPLARKGLFCEELRECSENIVCENGGVCEDSADDGAKCACAAGYSGPRCGVKDDDCGGCQNGGVCEVPKLLPADGPNSKKLCACPAGFTGKQCEIPAACTTPCPENAGASGERYHTFVYPDLVNRDHVFLCREGRLTHLEYCSDKLWYDPFSMECHTAASQAEALLTAGSALYPTIMP